LSILLILFGSELFSQNEYKNSAYGFKINFPENWIVKKTNQENTIVKAIEPSSIPISYISIAAYPITKTEIEYYKDASPQVVFMALKEEYEEIQIELIDFGIIMINGKRAIWTKVEICLTETKYIIASNYHLINDRYLFRITIATDGGTQVFNDLNLLFENTINSIVFNDF
jgi:hypothetical protein